MPDPAASAADAGLRYVSDDRPGIRRKRVRGAFVYVDPSGAKIADPSELARIRALAIPPAYEDVWISPFADGHLQATGRDARGRKQYRYHKRWREVRDETKFHRMLAFAKALPRIRERTAHDLGERGLPRERVLATIVRLLEISLIRVGNDEYARENASFGLTTMREDHVAVRGTRLRFRFRGKSGREHEIALHDARVAKIVAKLRDLPGQELFRYLDDDGEAHAIDSADVNAYLREISGGDFTAKDFRTWLGTVACALALAAADAAPTQRERKAAIVRAIEHVAQRLGNTPSVCRKSYVHPEVTAAFLESGSLATLAARLESDERDASDDALREDEAAVARFLRRRARASAEDATAKQLARSIADRAAAGRRRPRSESAPRRPRGREEKRR